MEKNEEKKRTRSERHEKSRWKKEVTEEPTLETGDEEIVRRRSDRHKKRKIVHVTIKSVIVTFFAIVIFGLISYTTILYGGKLLVDEEALMITAPTTIETEDGDVIWYLYDEFRMPVTLDDIPDHVQQAFISVEDRRFYNHSGVDFRSIVRAVYRDVVTRSKAEGASTITQQLAKNVFLTNDKTWLRKTKEMMIALHLEREYTKDEILEMYLNVIYFGHGQYGIGAAANKYFSKSVHELTVAEGALLAGMIKAPNSYSPIDYPEKALDRRNIVLQTMYDNEVISEKELNEAQHTDMTLTVSERTVNLAYSAYVDLTIREAADKYGLTIEDLRKKHYRIITALDTDFQKIAYEQFKNDDFFPGSNDDVEGAFVMMDQQKGEIVSAIGGRDFTVGDLNRVNVKRQPGSAIKPIAVFAPALMTEKFNPYSILPDELMEWDGHPVRNVDEVYDKEVTLIEAVKQSKNTSSYWLLNEIGVDYAKSYLEKLNITLEDQTLQIALGGLTEGMTPLQMAEGFRPFVHDGQGIESHAIKEIQNSKAEVIGKPDEKNIDIYTEQVAWNMTEILRETVRSGTATAGHYGKDLAGKTGTTEHPHVDEGVKDAWFVGFTPEYVTALWMGYDHSDENNYLTSGSPNPTRLTKAILTEMDKQRPLTSSFTRPDDVKRLAEQIHIPPVTDLDGKFTFGGFKIVKGKLTWTVSEDERIVYDVYKEEDGHVQKIGEMVNKGEFALDDVSLFDKATYFVVSVDEVSGIEGEQSEAVKLKF